MALENLSVRISADTADFMAGSEAVESQLGDLSSEAIQTAAALEILSNRADDAGDNVSQAGRDATTTAGQFSILSGATQAANASFLGISATTWGSLIPAVVALSAALAPVIGALGGFVAIAGSIAGIGMAGVIGAMATNGEQLKEAFSDLLPILEPLFDKATALLIHFSNELEETLGSMEIAGSVAGSLMASFSNLGDALINALPAFIQLGVTLANEFLPPFVEFTQNILPRLPGMIQGFVDVFERMLPKFMEAGRLLAQILPPFTEFGFTVLNVLGPALAMAAEEGTALLNWINGLSEGMQRLVAAGALLAPVVSVLGQLFGPAIVSAASSLASVLSGPVIGALGAVAAALGPAGIIAAAVVAAIGLFTIFEDEIRAAVNSIEPMIASAFNSAMAWLQSTGTKLVHRGMEAVGAAVRATAIEIHNMLSKPGESVIFQALYDAGAWLVKNGPGILITAMNTLVDLALAAWEGFKDGLIGNSIIPETFNDVVSWLLSSGVSMLVSAASLVGSAFLSPFEVVFNELYNLAIGAFSDIVAAINDTLGVLPNEITSELGFGSLDGVNVEERSTDLGQTFQSNQQAIQREIVERVATITVEDGEIVAKMEDVVDSQRQRDTTTLQANETPSP